MLVSRSRSLPCLLAEDGGNIGVSTGSMQKYNNMHVAGAHDLDLDGHFAGVVSTANDHSVLRSSTFYRLNYYNVRIHSIYVHYAHIQVCHGDNRYM